MNKGILIIGGGILQERAIFFAKKLGFEVHLVDGNSNCYCRNFVKNFYLIDCNNYKKIALIAKHLKKNKRISIKAVCVRNKISSTSFRTFYSWKKMINNYHPHLVIIGTPPKIQSKIIKNAS